MTYKVASGYYAIISSPKDLANAPASTVSDDAVWDYYGSHLSGNAYGQSGSWLTLTAPSSETGYSGYTSWRFGNALRPSIAEVIDLKVDDGLPTMGSVLAVAGFHGALIGGCGKVAGDPLAIHVVNVFVNGAASSNTIPYDSSDTRNTCNLLFRIGL